MNQVQDLCIFVPDAIVLFPILTSMNRYDNLLLIYYSGTGNARREAKWMAEIATDQGINVLVFPFWKYLKEHDAVAQLRGKTLVGFLSATHGFNLPHTFLKLIVRFNACPGADVFLVNTRGGMKLSKLFLPGLSGMAQLLPAMILWLKGYKIRAMRPVDLPSNWISLHPGLKTKVVDSIVQRWKNKTTLFTKKLLEGKKSYRPALISLPLDLLITPVGIGYYIIGRFFLAKTFFATDRCNDCMMCLKACPTKSIILKDNRPFWKVTCESCMHCMNFCPQRAIETNHNVIVPFLLILYLVIYPFLATQLMEWLQLLIPSMQWLSDLTLSVVKWVVFLGLFVLVYRGVHYLMHYKWFHKLMRLTTFTHFPFWRRYKIPKEVQSKNQSN
jgi:Pyruvate/2-oxoacid:ferredoxin oxidoreductase delta subunit